MKSDEQARSLFGISLSGRPKWHQFFICSGGFFFGYLVNGICEVLSLSLSLSFSVLAFCLVAQRKKKMSFRTVW
jgi:hypothetical protein